MSDEASPRVPSDWTQAHRGLLTALAHVGLFAFSWLLAFGLAYNFQLSQTGVNWLTVFFLPLLPLVVGIKMTVFAALGLHRGSWRYVSIRDVLQVTWATWLSFALIFVCYYVFVNAQTFVRWLGWETFTFEPFGEHDFPDSVLLLDFAGSIALVCGARIMLRLYYEEMRPVAEATAPRLLILGAGNAGESVLREILRMPVHRYQVVGFLDDDRAKWASVIHGVEVLGPISRVKSVCQELNVSEILIAMPSATRQQIKRVIEQCDGAHVKFKTLPAVTDLVTGRMQVQQIRDVDINDLLGRAPVRLDTDQIEAFLRDRVVLVSGAGGSIGSEMCRQIVRFRPRRLLLVEQAEQNLFEIDRELRARHADIDVAAIIADVCDARRVERIFSSERPTVVVHAAAHKHVPMMEFNPGEAIKNNVLGTRVMADAAARHGCEKFVLISTDKAVNPTSVMGASKRVAEMYVQGLNERCRTQFVTVRFGNVLGSSGSVVPIFRDQIARGGPVTVTHPDMVRYFMTIPEAAQLVLQSASMGRGGEIFVLDMGEPVKIVDLARNMIKLSGFTPDEDIEIRFTGIRPGEKLYEELSIVGEDMSRTAHPKVFIWEKKPEDWASTVPAIDRLIEDADKLSRDDVRARLKALVPEFHLEAPARPSTAAAAPAAETPAARVVPNVM